MDVLLLQVAMILCLLFTALPVAARTITRVASVSIGGSLGIREMRIRLHRVDAPELCGLCMRMSEQTWQWGQHVALALSDRIGRRSVSCVTRDIDRFGHFIAVCSQDGVGLNLWMAQKGWAVAYRKSSRNYAPDEPKARRAGRKIWSGTFFMPWDRRRGARSP